MHRIGLVRGRDANRADVAFINSYFFNTSGQSAYLRFEGNGRADMTLWNRYLQKTSILVAGAEFRINGGGSIATASDSSVWLGGTLTLDNRGTYKSVDGGTYISDRLSDSSDLVLGAGHLRYWGQDPRQGNWANDERVGQIRLDRGVNTIDVRNHTTSYTELRSKGISQGNSLAGARATLDLTGNIVGAGHSGAQLRLDQVQTVGGIIPWATVNGSGWASASGHYIVKLPRSAYANSLVSHANVNLSGTNVLTSDRAINSLRIEGASAEVDLSGNTLRVSSGGILSTGDDARFTNNVGSTGMITTEAGRPLYLHIQGNRLTVESGVLFSGNVDLVKAGSGELVYSSNKRSNIASLFVHQGKVHFRSGTIATTGEVTIGDGEGRDILKLGANRTGQLESAPRVNLIGSNYGAAGVLELSGGTVQHLDRLSVEGHGVIDFQGSGNVLTVDRFSFERYFGDRDRVDHSWLEILNWEAGRDLFLVKKEDAGALDLKEIYFAGEKGGAKLADYDEEHFQLMPFFPEPSTYGAMITLCGLVLIVFRRRARTSACE